MPWTNQQKKVAREKRIREELDWLSSKNIELWEASPPTKELKDPYKDDKLGNNMHDYGGHDLALNYPMPNELQFPNNEENNRLVSSISGYIGDNRNAGEYLKVGSLAIGLVYDSDYKNQSAGKNERTMCKKSEKYKKFLMIVAEMVMPQLDCTLKNLVNQTLRLSVVRGARTLIHTDSFRGNTPNFVYVVEPNNKTKVSTGYLQYNIFPKFKASIVKLDGKLFIPHSYSEASNEIRFVGQNPTNPKSTIFHVFVASKIHQLLPYGDLPFGLVGIRKGRLQVIYFDEGAKLYCSPLSFVEVTWEDAVEAASKLPVSHIPRKRIYSLKEPNKWHKFMAWQYRHWWKGNNMTLRYHCFFRTVRNVPTSSNVIREGMRINYVDAKNDDDWKIYNYNNKAWESIV